MRFIVEDGRDAPYMEWWHIKRTRVRDTLRNKTVFKGSYSACHQAARALNEAREQEKVMWEMMARSLIIPKIRQHPLPWNVTDTTFGADVTAGEEVIASCPNGDLAIALCKIAQELEEELASNH